MYELGVGLAFFMWLFRAIMRLVAINSTFEQNLNRIGQRLSWITLQPKAMEIADAAPPWWKSAGKYLLITLAGLPFVFFSWVYVASWLGGWAYFLWKDAGAPDGIKAFRWKMKNLRMSFDDLCRELMAASGGSVVVTFEEFRDQVASEMRDRGLDPGTGA